MGVLASRESQYRTAPPDGADATVQTRRWDCAGWWCPCLRRVGEAPLGGAEGLVFCVRVGGTRRLF
eukprot:COSAG02_NODE_4119_length_5750_cov_1.948151_1_plen_65_part_10